jgi:hypothetical protein
MMNGRVASIAAVGVVLVVAASRAAGQSPVGAVTRVASRLRTIRERGDAKPGTR